MWRLLPSALYNRIEHSVTARHRFFLWLLFFVFMAHCILFVSYIVGTCLYKKHELYHVSLNQQGATYVLMPLQKKVEQNGMLTSSTEKKRKKSRVIDQSTYLQEQKSKKHKNKLIQKSSTVLAPEIQKKKNKPVSAVKTSKNEVKKQSASCVASNQLSKKEIKSEKKEAIKPVEPIVEKQIQEIVQEKQEPVLEPAVQPEQVESTLEIQDALEQDQIEDEPIFIGYQQLEQSLIAAKIVHLVQQHWVAPKGINPKARCQVQVQIDQTGQVKEIKIKESSGIFIFDVRAKKALLSIEYPKEVWNKTIIVALGCV